jgi:hypothetical protein
MPGAEAFTELWESVSIKVGDQVVSRHTTTLRGRDGVEVTAHVQYL